MSIITHAETVVITILTPVMAFATMVLFHVEMNADLRTKGIQNLLYISYTISDSNFNYVLSGGGRLTN